MLRARRLVVAFAGLLFLLLFALTFRVAAIQLGLKDRAAARVANMTTKSLDVPARRGELLDRHGRPLAGSVAEVQVESFGPNIFCNRVDGQWKPRSPEDVATSIATIGATLGSILGPGTVDYATRLSDPRPVSHPLGAPTTDPDRIAALRAEEQNLAGRRGRLSRLDLRERWRRDHPWGAVGGNLLGWLRDDGTPGGGLELSLDGILAGADGRRVTRWDGYRELLPDDEPLPGVAPMAGRSVVLTIDAVLQAAVEEELKRVLEREQALAAVGVMVDVRSGDVLAMGSAPTLDPEDSSTWVGNGPRIGAAQMLYPPGSTFKPIMLATALEQDLVVPGEVIDCTRSPIWFGSRRVTDGRFAENRPLNLDEILIHSSNVGISQIMTRLVPEGQRGRPEQMAPLHDTLVRLGFRSRTQLPVPGESAGWFADLDDWTRNYSLTSLSYGYEVSVTALQMAAAIAALADGSYRAPRLIRGVLGEQGELLAAPASVPRPIWDAAHAAYVRRAMVRVVDHKRATYPDIGVPGVDICGKTGTASAEEPAAKAAGKEVHSFVALAPADDPQVALVVVVFHPGHARFSNQSAAPAASAILRRVLPYLGVEVTPSGLAALSR